MPDGGLNEKPVGSGDCLRLSQVQRWSAALQGVSRGVGKGVGKPVGNVPTPPGSAIQNQTGAQPEVALVVLLHEVSNMPALLAFLDVGIAEGFEMPRARHPRLCTSSPSASSRTLLRKPYTCGESLCSVPSISTMRRRQAQPRFIAGHGGAKRSKYPSSGSSVRCPLRSWPPRRRGIPHAAIGERRGPAQRSRRSVTTASAPARPVRPALARTARSTVQPTAEETAPVPANRSSSPQVPQHTRDEFGDRVAALVAERLAQRLAILPGCACHSRPPRAAPSSPHSKHSARYRPGTPAKGCGRTRCSLAIRAQHLGAISAARPAPRS